ncbi:hypothetical protein [Altericroceibacterium indicum]|nr:hypothetical protein [Altericroceibacterium indicum]
MSRKFILAVTVGLMALSTAACNTVRGAGEDIQSAANTVDDAT